jgi:FMN phosphatase YigB (HAD superfamily)
VPKAIVIDPRNTLTDESENHRNAVNLIRQIVAEAGFRVTESALEDAENFAVYSFAPREYETMLFTLVDRDSVLALKCISRFRKEYQRTIRLRAGAAQLMQAVRNAGWRAALATPPTEDEMNEFRRAGIWDLLYSKGPPAKVKIYLPDIRVLEFLVGQLAVDVRDCVMLGNRIDNHIRPANTMKMTSILLRQGMHGEKQLPRDLNDVPDYEFDSIENLIRGLPRVE